MTIYSPSEDVVFSSYIVQTKRIDVVVSSFVLKWPCLEGLHLSEDGRRIVFEHDNVGAKNDAQICARISCMI